MQFKTSGIILAGGRSTRMGRDKTLMKINGETLIEKMVSELGQVVDEVIIASNHFNKYNLPGTIEVPDLFTGTGPMGGIHAGLLKASHPYAFVVAADMPLFNSDLANFLINNVNKDYDVVAPEIDGAWEPLCAVYSQTCLKTIEEFLCAEIRNVYGLFERLRTLKINEQDLASIGQSRDNVYNMNTPEDYRHFLAGPTVAN